MSQLLIPGPRNTVFPALPYCPSAGAVNTLVSKYSSGVRCQPEGIGLPVTTARGESPPPRTSVAAPVNVVSIPYGAPFSNVVIPDHSHPLKIARLKKLFQ